MAATDIPENSPAVAPRRPPGRPRKLPETVLPPADVEDAGELEDIAPGDLGAFQEEERIRELLANEENTGAKLEVYRKRETGTLAYLTTLGLEEWTGDARQAIAKEFGGGDYRIRIRKAGGVFGPSFTFVIDRAVRPVPVDKPSELVEVMKMQRHEAGGTLPLLMQMMQQQQAQFQQSQNQLTQVLVAALGRPMPPEGGSSNKLLELAFTRLAQPPPTLNIGQLLGALKELKDLSGMGRNGGAPRESAPKDDGFWSGLLAQLPSLLAAVTQAGAPVPPLAPAPVAPLAPPSSALTVTAPVDHPPPAAPAEPRNVTPAAGEAGIPAPSPAGQGTDKRSEENRQALRALLDHLLPQAQAGTDPVAVAVQVSEALDDDNFTALAVVLQRDDWLALLSDVHEGVPMQSNWFIRWRERLLAELEEG